MGEDRHHPRAPVALFAILFALALGPTALVEIPAAADYANHLARMSILARDGTPAANPYYEAAWNLYPNLAMDLVVPPLARLIGVEPATRLFLLASQILLVGGAVAVELAVKRRFEIAGFVALLYLYSFPFAFGFLNFTFALALSLWGIAGWIALRERPLAVRLALHGAMVAALVVGHLFALGIYGLTLGLYELHGAWLRRDGARLLRSAAVLAAPALAAFAVLIVAGQATPTRPTTWLFAFKPLWLFALNGYSLTLSLILTLALAGLVAVLVRRRALVVQGAGLVLLAGYAAVFLVMPFGPAGTAYADMRVPVAAALVLPSFLTLRLPSRRQRLLVGAAMSGLILVNLGQVARVQTRYAEIYRQMVGSFAALKPAPRILVAARDSVVHPLRDLQHFPMLHAPTLAAHYADAFVSTLFTFAGQQPIAARAAVRRLASTSGQMSYVGALAEIARGASTASEASLADWPTAYDYLYLIGEPDQNPLPDLLDEVARGDFFTVYAIRAPAG